MHVLSASSLALRATALVIALSALAFGCADNQTASGDEVTPRTVAVTDAPEAPETADSGEDLAIESDAPDGRSPSPEVVTRTPAAPVARPSAPRPSTPDVVTAQIPERPPMTAPPAQPTPEAPAPRNTAGADTFWRTFQASVRSRNQTAIERGLAETIRVGDQTFARASEPVQDVIRAIVEEEAARDAYLAVESLTHGAEASTFETTATYIVDGETYEVIVFGTVEEVAPGDWRLVEVGSR